ncbi:hypothetical protein, partial [Streptomyces spinosisporus]
HQGQIMQPLRPGAAVVPGLAVSRVRIGVYAVAVGRSPRGALVHRTPTHDAVTELRGSAA